ncbi:MAG: rod shape-determining protein RodA [Rhodospirillales bacterium]|nr:rod shape-determining protein RodA [Rhodospirillales bacterium]
MNQLGLRDGKMSVAQKLMELNWFLVLMLCALAGVGFAMLYSGSNGSMEPWASRQMVRFGIGLGVMIVVALVDIRVWLQFAYPIYFVALVLLASVEFVGTVGMGAQRWVDLGVFQLQPSEVMKIALVLALARYFHARNLDEIETFRGIALPSLMVLVPAAMVLKQPDLGTALLLVMGSAMMFFAAGVRLRIFGYGVALGLISIPVGWQFLRGYQKERVLVFLNPESDPLGAGYHIMQSKIALGSGGVFGRGYMEGTQSHLNFLPEMQTDFIFTMLAEEFGLVGGVGLLFLYAVVIVYGMGIGNQSRHHFGRLVALGVTATFSLYVIINIAMVMGLLPVVGVPLPLVSYGGTAMMTLMIGFGFILCVFIHRETVIPKKYTGLE